MTKNKSGARRLVAALRMALARDRMSALQIERTVQRSGEMDSGTQAIVAMALRQPRLVRLRMATAHLAEMGDELGVVAAKDPAIRAEILRLAHEVQRERVHEEARLMRHRPEAEDTSVGMP